MLVQSLDTGTVSVQCVQRGFSHTSREDVERLGGWCQVVLQQAELSQEHRLLLQVLLIVQLHALFLLVVRQHRLRRDLHNAQFTDQLYSKQDICTALHTQFHRLRQLFFHKDCGLRDMTTVEHKPIFGFWGQNQEVRGESPLKLKALKNLYA